LPASLCKRRTTPATWEKPEHRECPGKNPTPKTKTSVRRKSPVSTGTRTDLKKRQRKGSGTRTKEESASERGAAWREVAVCAAKVSSRRTKLLSEAGAARRPMQDYSTNKQAQKPTQGRQARTRFKAQRVRLEEFPKACRRSGVDSPPGGSHRTKKLGCLEKFVRGVAT